MKGLYQVSHYPGETAIQIDCNQLGSIPNTNTGLPAMLALGHLWYNSGTHFAGSISIVPLGTLPDDMSIRTLTYPWPHTGSPHILTTSSVRTLTERGPT